MSEEYSAGSYMARRLHARYPEKYGKDGKLMPKAERKAIDAEIKLDELGAFEAAIATFDIIDSDRDIVKPGAFGDAVVSVLPAHDSGSVPLGKVQIKERGNLAVAVGGFNLEIEAARNWSSALKFDIANPPKVQQWSWGFIIPAGGSTIETHADGETVRVISKVDVFEVSPVLRGASVGTGTLSAKSKTGGSLVEQIKDATGAVAELVGRIREIAEGRRAKDGRGLGPDVRIATVEVAEEVSKLLGQLAKAIKEDMPIEKNSDQDEIERRNAAADAAARYLAMEAMRVGVEL